MPRREAVDLGVRLPVRDVAQSLLGAEPTRPVQHGRGDVDAGRAARDRGPGGLARGLAGATTDVEHAVVRADAGGGAEQLVVRTQLGVVVEQLDHHPTLDPYPNREKRLMVIELIGLSDASG
jgi:hypothetical protein